MTSFLARRRLCADDGAALLTTIFFVAILTALSATVTTITVNNVGNAARDRQGTAALALSEGGIAQAIAHLRTSKALKNLECSPTCGAANPWGEQPKIIDGDLLPGHTVTVATGETYEVWIEPIVPMDIPARQAGTYRVRSTGTSAGNPGNRTVQVDVQVAPFNYPLAVVADTVQPGGTGSVFNTSIFSKGCVFKRSKIGFANTIDAVYGIPSAVHSAQYITDSQATGGGGCGPNDNKNIHHASKSTNGCNTTYPYDQDVQGKNPVGAPCFGLHPAAGSKPAYPLTSKIESFEKLAEAFNFQPEGLTSEQLDILKEAAIEQGFYFTDTTAIPAVLQNPATAIDQPILFYDLKGSAVGGTVDLNDLNGAYSRSAPLAASSASCTGRAAFVVVLNGDVKMNANTVLAASVFAMGPAPYGVVNKLNGTAKLIGTVYARNLDLTGSGNIQLDECFVQNPPGQVLEVTVTNFAELDR